MGDLLQTSDWPGISLQHLLSETRDLAITRPIFHNEADFQHALAWHFHERWPAARVRLEGRPLANESLYLDIWLELEQQAWAIELKYPARRFDVNLDDEQFSLRNHGAQDITRYDFIRDIARLERITRHRAFARGLALLLTNDPSYWQPGPRADTIDAAFRLHQGRHLTGEVSWGVHAGDGTTKGRTLPHQLLGAYLMEWQDYSLVEGTERFRLLPVLVAGAGEDSAAGGTDVQHESHSCQRSPGVWGSRERRVWHESSLSGVLAVGCYSTGISNRSRALHMTPIS